MDLDAVSVERFCGRYVVCSVLFVAFEGLGTCLFGSTDSHSACWLDNNDTGPLHSVLADDEADEPVIENAEAADEPVAYVPPSNAEQFSYEAEVSRMLDIVVNSLYQNQDVFLRELISNASDALDKIRYLLLTEPDTYKTSETEIPLEVKIEYDEEASTLTIRDTGIGMTKQDMVSHLGTVARSGTTKFMEALKDGEASVNQIGQFGVGFYSTFLVADRVTVASKHPTSAAQYVWESTNGASEFHIYEDPRGASLERGTEITLHLKSGDARKDYTSFYKLKQMASHYSEFVTYPISLRQTETMEVEVEDEEEEAVKDEEKKDEDDLEVGDDEDAEGEEEKPKKMKEVTTYNWEVINGNPAIWTRDKDEIADAEYQSFWKVLTGGSAGENATAWSHFNAEGNINFKSILYLPDEIPPNYRYGNMDKPDAALRLYVRKVLIGDNFDLLPRYLGFIRGVVDSDDLPLNVNRETLQESKVLKVIQKKLVRKAIDLIRQVAKESEEESDTEEETEDGEKTDSKYVSWYKKFSQNIKLGVLEDRPNQGKLMKLLRYESSKSDGKLISLQDYVGGMKEWQKDIYVLGCQSTEECANSPFLETFTDKDVEVLFLTDPMDEYLAREVRDFDSKKLVQISSENVKLHDEDEDLIKRREKVYQKQYKPLTKWLRKLYKGSVMRVQIAKRALGSIPAVVTSSEYGNSANMERILRAQAFSAGVDASQMGSMKVFELNPRHPIVVKLLEGCPDEDADDDAVVDKDVEEAAWMLHDMAMLSGGYPVSNPEALTKRMAKVLQSQFELDSLKLEPEINPPVEVEDEDDVPDLDGLGDLNDIDLDALKAQMGDMGDVNIDLDQEL